MQAVYYYGSQGLTSMYKQKYAPIWKFHQGDYTTSVTGHFVHRADVICRMQNVMINVH